MTARIRQQWSKLTDDDVADAKGDRDLLLGRIVERYGVARDEADRRLRACEDKLRARRGVRQARSVPDFGRRSPVDLLRVRLAILLPPVGVLLQVGLGLQFRVNILLTLPGCIPGIVHAVWIIARR